MAGRTQPFVTGNAGDPQGKPGYMWGNVSPLTFNSRMFEQATPGTEYKQVALYDPDACTESCYVAKFVKVCNAPCEPGQWELVYEHASPVQAAIDPEEIRAKLKKEHESIERKEVV